MKIYLKQSFFVLSILFFTVGCEKDFLDRNNPVGTDEANFYQTEEDAVSAVIAAYDVLQYELTPSGHFRWFFGDVVSDDAIKGGSGDNDAASLGRLERFEGQATNELVQSEWLASYKGIARSNIVLERVPDIEMDINLQVRLLAEVKFIRAYFYYNLVTIFGDVPLLLKTLSPSESDQARTPKAEVWAQIEKDLTEAIPDLPRRSQMPLTELGRITQGTAQAMLLKAYMFQSKFADAQPLAEAIVNSNEYSLDPDFANIFTQQGENGPGSIFEIQYMNASNGDWGRFAEGTLTNVFQRARGQFGGYGFNIPTQDLVSEFSTGDPRLAATIFQEGDQMGDRGVFTKAATGQLHDYYAKKYFINSSEEAPTGDPNVNGPSNDRVIRYADVLLMHAEAAYHNGAEGAARNSVNLVRERARGNNPPFVVPPISVSGPDLLQAIYKERRLELALEGHRFFDLVRQGRAGEVMRAHGLNFVDDVHELFPIPLTEIQASNGAIIQNFGY